MRCEAQRQSMPIYCSAPTSSLSPVVASHAQKESHHHRPHAQLTVTTRTLYFLREVFLGERPSLTASVSLSHSFCATGLDDWAHARTNTTVRHGQAR